MHPCYPQKHEENHCPLLSDGVVIKTNTNAVSYFLYFYELFVKKRFIIKIE